MEASKGKYKRLKLLAIAIMIIIVVAIAAFGIFAEVASEKAPAKQEAVVAVGGHELQVEMVSTPKQQYQGLSGRTSLCPDCGMLFVFADSGPKSFVMRDMAFPLDIIFIESGVIKSIAANLAPEGHEPKNIYSSTGASDQVLEVNAGYCAKYGIEPGAKVIIR